MELVLILQARDPPLQITSNVSTPKMVIVFGVTYYFLPRVPKPRSTQARDATLGAFWDSSKEEAMIKKSSTYTTRGENLCRWRARPVCMNHCDDWLLMID